jgi:hypothetical protein
VFYYKDFLNTLKKEKVKYDYCQENIFNDVWITGVELAFLLFNNEIIFSYYHEILYIFKYDNKFNLKMDDSFLIKKGYDIINIIKINDEYLALTVTNNLNNFILIWNFVNKEIIYEWNINVSFYLFIDLNINISYDNNYLTFIKDEKLIEIWNVNNFELIDSYLFNENVICVIMFNSLLYVFTENIIYNFKITKKSFNNFENYFDINIFYEISNNN